MILASSAETVAPSSIVMKTTDLLVRIFEILTMSFGLRASGGIDVVVVVVSIIVVVGRESGGTVSSAFTLCEEPTCNASAEINATQAMFANFLIL